MTHRDWPCPFTPCQQKFADKQGLGVHISASHRNQYRPGDAMTVPRQDPTISDDMRSLMKRSDAYCGNQMGTTGACGQPIQFNTVLHISFCPRPDHNLGWHLTRLDMTRILAQGVVRT